MTLRRRADGFTLIELLIVIAIIGIIAGIAIPTLLRARVSSNEASAIASMRVVVSAQSAFEAISGGFADDLATLAATCPGSPGPFLSPDLGSNNVEKSGYRFVVGPGAGAAVGPNDCFGNPTQSAYYISATPLAFGITGARAFAANRNAAIWQDTTGVPPTEPFTVGASVGPLGR